MALTAWIRGARPASWWLPALTLELTGAAVAAIPPALAAWGALSAGPARAPWFTDPGRPLPLVQAVDAFSSVARAAGPLVPVAAVVGVLVHLVATGFVLELRRAPEPGFAWRSWGRSLSRGRRWLRPFLWVSALAVAALALAGVLVALGFRFLASTAPDTLDARLLLGAARGAAFAVLGWLVGAAALGIRTTMVALDEPRLRVALPRAVGTWRRAPVASLLVPAIVAAAGFAIVSAALVGWRQTGGGPGWWALFALAAVARACGWLVTTAALDELAPARPSTAEASPRDGEDADPPSDPSPAARDV